MKRAHLIYFLLLLFVLGMLPLVGLADRDRSERQGRHERQSSEFRMDKRFEHNHAYPREGHRIKVLPQRRRPIHFRNHDYFYLGGVWYQPSGVDFVVIRPPLGIVVPILPPFYTTLWLADVPYYYANGVYYQWRADLNGYQVVEIPLTEEKQSEITYMADKLFIYPKKGQNKKQQADDSYDCHQFGVEKTGYDPSQPPTEGSAETISRQREDYQRAMKTCLEGKGYSVR